MVTATTAATLNVYLAHHLIRVIKSIWLRHCTSAYFAVFIHCTRTWKGAVKRAKCWLDTLPHVLGSWWTAICLSTLICMKTVQSCFIFFQWEGFWCFVEVLKNSIVISPETKAPSSCCYNISACLMGQNGESVSTNWEWCSISANFSSGYCEMPVRQLYVWGEISPK